MEKYVEFIANPDETNSDDLYIDLIDHETDITSMSLYELFEYQLCNGWSFVNPEDLGALTDAPILSEEIIYNDNGEVESIGIVYWFPDYMIVNIAEQLTKYGRVVFSRED